jgi:membrane protease YdiL (CAAX protease family)
MKAFIRRHPTASYFAVAFLLSWGGILAVLRGRAIPAPPDEAQRLFALVYLAMLVGPSVAGIAITAFIGGTRGLADLRGRLLTWRVAARWYAVALLAAPLTLLAALVLLSPLSGDFVPALIKGIGGDGPVRAGGRASFVLMGLLVAIGAGFFEELGWTGVAVPNLRRRHDVLMTGVLVGLMWGAWHLLAILWGSASSFGSVPIALYLAVALFSFLPPFRVLMAWVYDRTQSLLVAVLMHASLTASMLTLGPSVVGGALLTFDLAFAALLWGIVGIVAWSSGRTSQRTHGAGACSGDPRIVPRSAAG